METLISQFLFILILLVGLLLVIFAWMCATDNEGRTNPATRPMALFMIFSAIGLALFGIVLYMLHTNGIYL